MDLNNDKSWNKYMENNQLLTDNIKYLVKGYANQVENGQSKKFNVSTSMEIENGEQIIGYQYLHGTNTDVGGFQIIGTITKNKNGNAAISFYYQWNDRIDPNFQYNSDINKSSFAQKIPFADPKDYTLRIGWSDKSELNSNGIFTSGWLSNGEPKPTYQATKNPSR